jgi:hypothetical protein
MKTSGQSAEIYCQENFHCSTHVPRQVRCSSNVSDPSCCGTYNKHLQVGPDTRPENSVGTVRNSAGFFFFYFGPFVGIDIQFHGIPPEFPVREVLRNFSDLYSGICQVDPIFLIFADFFTKHLFLFTNDTSLFRSAAFWYLYVLFRVQVAVDVDQ